MYHHSASHRAGTETMHGKKVLTVFLCVLMLLGCFGTGFAALAAGGDIASGSVSEAVAWRIDGSGVLRISGAGAIPDCAFWSGKSTAPWFDWHEKITGIVIGEGITAIGESAFAAFHNTGYKNETTVNCRLTQLSFPSTLKKIGRSAFCETYFDCDLVLPDAVTEIGSCAFECNDGAFQGRTLKLPRNLTRIEGHTFMNCGFTGALTLPQGLTGIYDDETSNLNDSYAFGGNHFTGTLTIPDSVTYIGKSAFALCDFSGVRFGSGSQLRQIGDYAFYANHNLRGTLSLPNGLQTIGASAFEDCTSCSNDSGSAGQGLTGSLAIPASVTSIGERAFACNYWLNGRLTVGNPNASVGRCAFHACASWTDSISAFYQNRPDLVYVKRAYLIQGKDGRLDSNTSVEDPNEYRYYVYCAGCNDLTACTAYANVSPLVGAGRLRSARTISLTAGTSAPDDILPVYELVERTEPDYDHPGLREHYVDDNQNCFVQQNNTMTPVAKESLVIPALVRMEDVLVPEELAVTVGKTAKIELTVHPANAAIRGVAFASADESVATVTAAGVVKGVAVGTTTVTVSAPDGIAKTVSVVVLEKPQRASFADRISAFFDSLISFFLSLFSFR